MREIGTMWQLAFSQGNRALFWLKIRHFRRFGTTGKTNFPSMCFFSEYPNASMPRTQEPQKTAAVCRKSREPRIGVCHLTCGPTGCSKKPLFFFQGFRRLRDQNCKNSKNTAVFAIFVRSPGAIFAILVLCPFQVTN